MMLRRRFSSLPLRGTLSRAAPRSLSRMTQ
jgi:hypothetical protein